MAKIIKLVAGSNYTIKNYNFSLGKSLSVDDETADYLLSLEAFKAEEETSEELEDEKEETSEEDEAPKRKRRTKKK